MEKRKYYKEGQGARRRKVLVKRDRELEKWESWQDKEEEQWGYDHYWSLGQWN